MLDHVDHLACAQCGEEFRPARRTGCPQCEGGGALRFVYRAAELRPFDRAVWARREPWLWRFRELLPFDDDLDPPPLQVGMTPLYGSPRLAARCGVRGLFVKDESRNPTGRTADRAAALLVAEGLRREGPLVAGALAPSVAAFAASAEKPALALLEAQDPANDVAAYGARVLRLGPKLERSQALRKLAAEGFYPADLPNPLALEGLKTLGLELGDQLAERLPEWIALDARQPGLVEAVQRGLAQCAELGLFRRVPLLLAVGGEGGDAQVELDPTELPAFADEARRALGLPVTPAGVAPLAGLARAVAEGAVSKDALALAVVEAPVDLSAAALTEVEPLPDYEALMAAARKPARR